MIDRLGRGWRTWSNRRVIMHLFFVCVVVCSSLGSRTGWLAVVVVVVLYTTMILQQLVGCLTNIYTIAHTIDFLSLFFVYVIGQSQEEYDVFFLFLHVFFFLVWWQKWRRMKQRCLLQYFDGVAMSWIHNIVIQQTAQTGR